MANLKDIRNRIKSVKSTQQVTKAMKMVAAAKLKRAQDRIIQLRPYAAKLREIIGNVTSVLSAEDIPSDLVKPREIKNVLIVLVTSNRGLCGPFNTNIIKEAAQFADNTYAREKAQGRLHFLCIGRKGHEYFKKRGYQVLGENRDVFTNLTFETVNQVIEEIFEGYRSGKFDKVHLVYNEFKNVMQQNRKVETFLPLAAEEMKANGEEAETKELKSDYIFEPGREEILEELIPKALRLQVFRAVLESNAAEQGARMVAMDTATENANELLKELRISYNKARQAAITKEILEIASGANALEA
ncbi:MAG: ATP synthase F1 subunit gamma [Bacteroidetes bacterium]|nr:MAG: ATP synthase F1 subunit gamma [Bacteroidota bacterium]